MIFLVFEFLGTVAFAISGAIAGMRKNMDYFGIVVLGCVTACGGGIIRDILIGATPTVAFEHPVYFIVSMASVLVLIITYRFFNKISNILQIIDALGLGAFTALGCNVVLDRGISEPFLIITLGVMSGVGGGVLRDVFSGNIPFIFQKEVYAVASITGAIGFYLASRYLSIVVALYICLVITFSIRIIAIKLKLYIPNHKVRTGLNQIR